MKKNSKGSLWAMAAIMALALTACIKQVNMQSSASPAATIKAPSLATVALSANQATYTDPFVYCSAVGTVDTPDSRYNGVPVPDSIIQGYLKAAGLENNGEPMALLQKSTIWRCMNNSVYVCNFGANLPCDSKADTDKNPTQPMQDFCKANPNAIGIPMSVTGHATIYSWSCDNVTPKLLDQFDQPDAAGFLTRIWYKLQLNP
jgi:hypothetical protein